jgi:alpha-L-rhamnosidase
VKRKGYYVLILAGLFQLASVPAGLSQQINSDLLMRSWPAEWIACANSPGREFGVYRFRRTFELRSVPTHFVVHASGDNRYELFVNSGRVVEGPARGDLFHWRFETLDIAPQLRAGSNTLAAVAWNFAEHAPMAQMTNETGFILQGDTKAESVANTGTKWKCHRDSSIEMIPPGPQMAAFYYVAGPGEQVDGTHYPWGWETGDFDDSGWMPAATRVQGAPRGARDSHARWMFVPRNIPLMEERPQRFARVARARGMKLPEDFLKGGAAFTFPAHSEGSLLVDQTFLTTAYPELLTSGGRGAEITLTYAEALWKGNQKGNRNEIEGKEIRGYRDRFLPDGGEHRLFRPLWWRTFRYVQIAVKTADDPVTIEDFRAQFTAYPFTERARFESDDPELQKMWEVGWRTARLCAHETYMDCPYYEQLQYAGDTRIQALISLYMTGDDRLVKNAIDLLDESRTPEGLTQSRYPSFLPQYIPPFSLLWIGMMHDLWWYHGDADFLRRFLPGERDVLGWFESRLTSSGLLGKLEWWDFVDWNKDFEDGVPPQEPDGQSAILSLQFAAALHEAADLETSFGRDERARHFRALAKKITTEAYEKCWDAQRGLLADTPAKSHFSQHATILGVLTDAIPAADQQAAMRRVLNDPNLTQCSYYFRFYLFRAMKKAGLANQYLAQLGPWRKMLSLGLTTFGETPEPTRSDCHAWSAHPNFDLLATVAGIEPASAGFKTVKIHPHLGALKHLTVTMPHPQGDIRVEYTRDGNRLTTDIELPGTLSGSLAWEGHTVPLHAGAQHINLAADVAN